MPLTDYYPAVDGYVSFRYSRNMTVPGKGGRPRKWRSDADRVRAHRARQRGDDEPPTVDIALDDGDEVALAWERNRELANTVEEQRTELAALRSQVRQAEKNLEQVRTRFSWIEADNDRMRSELETLRNERDLLQGRLDESRLSTRPIAIARATPAPPAAPNRAQRRRAERERRRKPDAQ